MLTQCPKCETIYRLSAAELKAAEGFVECGECGEQFNALERLADEPQFTPAEVEPESSAHTPPSESSTTADSAPTFVLVDDDSHDSLETDDSGQSTLDLPAPTAPAIAQPEMTAPPIAAEEFMAVPDAPTVAQSHNDEQESAPVVETPPPETPPTSTLPETEHAILFTSPEDEYNEPQANEVPFDDDIPAVLADDVARLRSESVSSWRWFWWATGLLTLVILVAQLFWAFRDQVVAVYPETRKVYARSCAYFGCEWMAAEKPEAIELIARDVRDHPQFVDALLVNATLISRSDSITAFPVIELGLYGQTGEAIGVRRFEPREYLDKSIDLAAGMPPNRPVYIVMEVAGVGPRAVSFEFKFL